jgi:hypothetical protein
MFEYSVSKDMKRKDIRRKMAIGHVAGTFMSNTNYPGIENQC